MAKHPRFREAWGQCGTCGFDVPVSRLRFNGKYGWQCTGAPGADCFDTRPDIEDYLQARRFPPNEGVRRTKAPLTNTSNEGIDADEADQGQGFGNRPFGSGRFGR